MPRTTFNAANITTLTSGQSIGNGSTTPSEAGSTQTIALSTGGTVTFQGDRLRCTGNAGVARLDEAISSFGFVTVDDLWNIPSAPVTGDNRIYEFRHATNYACRVEQNTNRTLVVLNAANTAIWTSAAIPLGEVRLRITLNPDETAEANGDFQIDIFTTSPRSSTTPDQTWSTTASDFDANALTAVRRGRISSTASTSAVIEPIYFQTEDTLSAIGPLAGAPTIALLSDGPYWGHDVRTTSSPGGAATFSIVHTSGPNNLSGVKEPIDGWFFIPQDTSVSTYTITATGPGGSDTEVVTVPAAAVTTATGIRRRRYNGTGLVG
jgi:hypothetical protein